MDWKTIVNAVNNVTVEDQDNMSEQYKILGMCVVQIEKQRKQIEALTEKVGFLNDDVGQLIPEEEEEEEPPIDNTATHDTGIVMHGTETFVRSQGYFPVVSREGFSTLYTLRANHKLVVLSPSQMNAIRTIN